MMQVGMRLVCVSEMILIEKEDCNGHQSGGGCDGKCINHDDVVDDIYYSKTKTETITVLEIQTQKSITIKIMNKFFILYNNNYFYTSHFFLLMFVHSLPVPIVIELQAFIIQKGRLAQGICLQTYLSSVKQGKSAQKMSILLLIINTLT